MAWSVALACASAGEPADVFRPGLEPDPDAAARIARGLHPAGALTETGDTVLDFALWPYEDELFVGAFGAARDGRALLVCDRRLFRLDDDARRVADATAAALPGARCGVLVLHSVVRGCWFRWYEDAELRRDVFLTAEDGVIVDQGARLPAERPFWRALDAGAPDVPLPFDPEEFGLALAAAHMFGRGIADRGTDGFLPLELPLRRFKLAARDRAGTGDAR
ncbi:MULTISPECIES: DUF6928 family protein [Actinomadura]|uniref:DUF6928 family protein n=1 Tax=Actinomadura TaxID=1988 RepID=UPI00042A2414|nr:MULTISPECIES: hypothetical protein [Actinomadura]RSN48433.1 hypothetical protein DMH08_34090 [Actinomadura sp. WAC 06369]